MKGRHIIFLIIFSCLTGMESIGQKKPCPAPKGGTRKPPPAPSSGNTGLMGVFAPYDPNLIIGPDGQLAKKWVSIKDRMPYTILFENDSTATAPARFIRIITPIEPKQDPSTFQLGSFGFNNLSFDIPPGTASYYTRLDVRDSTGLYIDVTAGYDQINNVAFWEFQGIDPVTQLPPDDPLVGFLFLQDSTRPEYGNGFVNFSIRPRTNAVTLDTIAARAEIVFDNNALIPTNIHTNTIDAVAPVSDLATLPGITPNTEITLTYSGSDDPNGSGVKWYSIYVSDNAGPPALYISNFTGVDTTFHGSAGHIYRFYLSATDIAGNIEAIKLVDSVNVITGEFVICPGTNISFNATVASSYQWQVNQGSGFTNLTDGGVYSGTNGSALYLQNAPSSMYGYQYRALINGSTYSHVYLLKFGMTWEGATSTDWENSFNWSCGTLPDHNTDVVINGGKTRYPHVNSNITIRSLRMNPGAAVQVNTGRQLNILK